jgi:hypothetical protein
MDRKRIFPAVLTERTETEHYGVAGMRLESILKNELAKKEQLLFYQGYAEDEDRGKPWNGTDGIESLLQAISGWPADTTIEMLINAHPDLISRPQSMLTISIIIKTTGNSREEVMEKAIARYMAMANLLPAHLPEADFIPITSSRELSRTLAPFKAQAALAVQRRSMNIALTHPFKQPATVGFGKSTSTRHGNSSHQVVHHIFPWKPTSNTWRRLLDTMLAQLDPIQLIVRMKKSTDKEKQAVMERLEQAIMNCEQFMAGDGHREIVLRRQAESLRDLSLSRLSGLREYSFQLGVYLASAGRLDPTLGQVTGNTITATTTSEKLIDILRGGFQCTEISPEKTANPDYFHEAEPFTLRETACAFRLPSPPAENQLGLPAKNFRTTLARMPAIDNQTGIITLAINKHRHLSQPIMTNADDRMRHSFIIGQTGTGKSTMMESMILQDIRNGRGVAVIDPHGEMVEEIIGKIPAGRKKDVVYFNLLDREMPPSFNLLRWSTIEERDIIIDELYMTMDHLYDMRKTGGPIFEQYFRGMLRLLLGDKISDDFTPTLLEFGRCFQNTKFRNWLKSRTSDLQTIDFLKQVESAGGDLAIQNVAPYITSKLTRFTQDSTIQRIIGQEGISVDFEAVMNSGKILLMNLGKGRFGSTISALIANQVVARFKLAAMKRGEMRPEQRRDFFLYVDECQNLPAGSFSELLSEARKYRLGLVLATQYAAQLKKQTSGNELSGNLLDAITGNVGTILIFRVGNTDAETMAPILYPSFSKEDIIGLPNWHGYSRLQPEGQSIPPCSFIGIKDNQPYKVRVANLMRKYSREKYGTSVEQIDLLIQRRRSRWQE